MKSSRLRRLVAAPYLVWIVGFTILPLITIIYYAFTERGTNSFTFKNILSIRDPIHFNALVLSLWVAFLSTLICLLLAYPLSYILSKLKNGRGRFVVFLFVLPMWMNHILRTLALQNLLSNTGVINGILEFLRLPTLNIMNTPTAIIIGMVYTYLPFMILPIYNSIAKIDDGVIDAAYDLGASGFTVFRRLILPLSLPGIISGITMVFVPSISEFVIADMLGGSKTLLIGNVIEQEFTVGSNWNLGSGLSVVLMVFIVASMVIMQRYDGDGEGAALW